jgi:hypothetical protein
MWRDGVRVQLSKADVPCGQPGDVDPVPLTFGDYNITGARPIDVFNTLVNIETQMDWDTSISSVNLLGNWQDEGVRGLNYVYPSGVTFIADREIFEWAAYEADFGRQDFLVVFSTLASARLHNARHPEEGTVQFENCLAAYWIRPRPGGGTHVTKSHHLNWHPPMALSPRFVFGFLWNADVNWVNIFREACRATAYQNGSRTETPLPDWLLRGPPLPRGDPDRAPMTCFNLTEEGILKVEIGASHQAEMRNVLGMSLVVVVVGVLACVVTRVCFRSHGFCKSSSISSELKKDNELGERENTQNSSSSTSEDESQSEDSHSRRNCRCLTMNT